MKNALLIIAITVLFMLSSCTPNALNDKKNIDENTNNISLFSTNHTEFERSCSSTVIQDDTMGTKSDVHQSTTYADDNSNQVSTHQYINETMNNQDEKTLTLTELSSIFSLNLDEHIFNVETFNQEELSSSVNNYSCKTVFNKGYYDTFIKLLNDFGYHSFDIVNRKHDVSVFNEETGLSIDYQKVVSGYHYFKTVGTDDKTPVMIRRRFIVLVEQRNSSLYNAYFFVY